MGKAIKRYTWLADLINLNNIRVGAEIGCAKGMTTFRLLKDCPTLELLYAVDLWDNIQEEGIGLDYVDWDFLTVEREFLKRTAPYNDRMSVLRGLSWEMAKEVPDNSLGMVFIDASHERVAVKRDVIAWTPKLIDGGFLCGHDVDRLEVRLALEETLDRYIEAGCAHIWWAYKEDFKK